MATPKFFKVSELPPCKLFIDEDVPEDHPVDQEAGLGTAIVNGVKGIPPCVWIENAHTQPIGVILSPSRPHRLATGGNVEASNAGAGLTLETAMYEQGSTYSLVHPGIYKFIIPSRREQYAIISIYGYQSGRECYFQNSRLPAGTKAVFKLNKDLKRYSYNKKLMTTSDSEYYVPDL